MKRESVSTRGMSQRETSGGAHPRVLVVESDAASRARIASVLRRTPLIVDETGEGKRALELLSEHEYVVALLDLQLPDLEGIQLVDAIGRQGPAARTVVIAVTGPDPNRIEGLDGTRVHGLIRKPYEPEEIASVIAACAEIRGRGAFDAMAIAALLSGAPLMALLKL